MLHNFIEIPDFTEQSTNLNIKSILGIREDEKVVLFIGRVTKDKGIDLLIEAFRLLRQEDKKVFLIIAGQIYDSTLKSSLKNLPDGVKFLGIVKTPYPYYEAADLIALPSKVDSFPYIMLEAAIMRKPFLGTRIGGISEFIDEGITGTLFTSGNVKELSNKIRYLLDNQNIANNMADKLYEKVSKELSRESYITKLNKIYDGLLV